MRFQRTRQVVCRAVPLPPVRRRRRLESRQGESHEFRSSMSCGGRGHRVCRVGPRLRPDGTDSRRNASRGQRQLPGHGGGEAPGRAGDPAVEPRPDPGAEESRGPQCAPGRPLHVRADGGWPRPGCRCGAGRHGVRLALPDPVRPAGGRLPRPGGADPLRDLPSGRRPGAEAASRQGGGPAVAVEARQLLFQAGEAAHRPGPSAGRGPDPRPGDPAHRAKDRHRIRPPCADQERAPVEVLGPGHLHRRPCAAAGGLRQAPGGALPADGLPRPLPGRHLRVPHHSAGPGPEAGLFPPVPPGRL